VIANIELSIRLCYDYHMKTSGEKPSWALKAVFGAIFTALFAIIAVGAIMHFNVNYNNQNYEIEFDEASVIDSPTIDGTLEI